jgi:hypothetical protein
MISRGTNDRLSAVLGPRTAKPPRFAYYYYHLCWLAHYLTAAYKANRITSSKAQCPSFHC